MVGASAVPYADVGVGRYLSERPSTRFPVYTRGNAGEVWPEVAYPLTISLSRSVGDDVFARASLGTGLIDADELAEGPSCLGGVFGGYMYINASVNRVSAVRMPGLTVDEADATFLGTERAAPPYEPHPDDRNWRASLRGLRWAWRVLGTTDVPRLADDRALVDRWRERLPELLTADDAGLLATVRALIAPTMDLFAHHLDVTLRAGTAVQALAAVCERALDDRSLAITMLGGLGEVDSAAPSFELWRLGRIVATDEHLAALFDRGVDGLDDRLRADERASWFVGELDAFLARFGSRGPNEWESACDTWGTDPTLPLALVDRMRRATDDHDPARRRAAVAREREAAIADALDRLRGPKRWLFRRTLRAAMVLSQARERSKTIVVDLIHVSRLLTGELDRRLIARSGGRPKDLWFVDAAELDQYVRDPASLVEVVVERRRVREELARRVPPFVFTGTIPPADTWPLRDDVASVSPCRAGDRIDGLAGCAGVAEGRARVVSDPGDPGDLGPGDVLIAPITDPSWTPLFVPVEAVVVDVGGQMSHAVIVSRELGRPCVVGATAATVRIPDGALVRVDGSAGTVTVLSDPALGCPSPDGS
jgi:phosphohistidine swiveling domain-containing protein